MKLLKSITVITFLLCTTLASAQWWGNGKKVKGNGDVTTVTRSTSNYDGVKLSGSMDIMLVEGKEGNISIKGESNLLEYVETEVKNNYLTIRIEKGINIRTTRPLVVTVPYESLDVVALAGSGDINNSGTLSSDDLKVSIAGSGDIQLKIDAEDLESSIAGSGDIELKGKADNLTLKIAGSGDFDGDNLNSTNVSVKISGSGTANVVCNGDLKARVAGSGDVNYKGNPTSKDTKVMGSGSISN